MACSSRRARPTRSALPFASEEGGMKFPNEDAKYRTARNKLLQSELSLRREIEKVAATRRKLPPGGKVPEDYVFDSEAGNVRLSELFVTGDTLVAYSFMF